MLNYRIMGDRFNERTGRKKYRGFQSFLYLIMEIQLDIRK